MTCHEHRWSEPRTVWVINQAGELVPHPTLRMRVCLECPAEETTRVGGSA